MSLPTRSLLERELSNLRDDILRLSNMIDIALDKAMLALTHRDIALAQQVDNEDSAINELRYAIEFECLQLLATQRPAATDLRIVLTVVHLASELERIGDHAAGIARIVNRLEGEESIDTLHKLPKMAKRARQMIQQGITAYAHADAELAHDLIRRDDKIDKQYNQLFQETIKAMHDDDYIRRATYLLWVGHNLERVGDRATNIAERVIFMVTGEFTEFWNINDGWHGSCSMP